MVESQTAVFEAAETIVKIFVNLSGIYNFVGQGFQFLAVFEKVHTQSYLTSFKKSFREFIIPTNRNTLIFIVEIIIVIGKPHRKSFDDEGWQFCGFSSPLLFGIAFNQFVVDVRSDEGDRLFFQVLWLGYLGFF